MDGILIILAGVVLAIMVIAVFLIFFMPSKSRAPVEDEEDELIFDEITGKAVSVEELVASHEIKIATEEKAEEIHRNLKTSLRNALTEKDVYRIMEAYYNTLAVSDDENPFEPLEFANALSEEYKNRGKEVESEELIYLIEQF